MGSSTRSRATKFNGSNFLALSNHDRERKTVGYPPQSCIHMWPVEPHSQTGTAVSGQYGASGFGQ